MHDSKIRPATPDEIESLGQTADLGPGCLVVAMENPKGKPDLAVIRQTWGLDLFPASESGSRKAAFVWALETALRLQGVPAYYFNIGAEPELEPWRDTVEHWGAVPTNQPPGYPDGKPEIRFKKVL